MSEDYNIHDELKGMGSPLADISKNMPYSVPVDYFNAFRVNTTNENLDGELIIQHTDLPFPVPQIYFEELPMKVLAAAKSKEQLLNKNKRIIFAPRLQWLTAAMLALIVSLGGYIMFSSGGNTNSEKMLSAVSRNDIHEYLQHRYDVDPTAIIENQHVNELKVENKDIVAYLNDTGWE